MSRASLYLSNPLDGTDTFDKIEIRRDADSYAAQYALVDITTNTSSKFGVGYTKYDDDSSSATRKYKVRFYDSSDDVYGEYSDIIQTGHSQMMDFVRTQLRDTDSSNYIFSDTELEDIERSAVDSLFPKHLYEDTDTSQTMAENVIDYDLPIGTFRVLRIYQGSLADGDWDEVDDFQMVNNGRQIRLDELSIDDGEPLTVEYTRPFRNAGEVPNLLWDVVMYEMLASAYEILSNDRGVKFKAFASMARDSDVRPETLQELSNRFRTLAESRRREIERG